MKRYEKYKDSGINWIGEIPEHWKIKRVKYCIRKLETGKREINPKSNDILSIGGEHINSNGKIEIKNPRYVSQEFFDNFKNGKIEKDDILMVKDGATIGKTAFVDFDPNNKMLLNEHVYKIVAHKFYYYFFLSHFFQNTIWKENQSSAQEGITRSTILNTFSFFIPSFKEQSLIASFLDHKTAEIDELILRKERLLELYEEEKTAIINQAVTKGINPDVKMKDSGIDWLGEIPEHWEVIKLNGVCEFVRGNSNFKKDELLNNGKYIALQYGKTYKVNEIDEEYEFYVNDEFYKISQVVKYGDVILISTSETIDDLGHSVFYNRKDIGLLGGEQILLRPNWKIVNGKYLYYSSKVFTKELRKYATGIKVFRFNISDLKKIYISTFPLEEQQQIVNYIEKEINRINTKAEKTKKLIELLKEYKQALISEVVTGKIKVV